MSRLVECLLEPDVNTDGVRQEQPVAFSHAEDTEHEEAAIT
ncbi:MAG TPA: hypothetical protein VLA93_15795 [Pyrinomonadaceae bacterium]|nr:hypothetical protein [Pyrinomonadaceae bacterium]